MLKMTKQVCTIGPKSQSKEMMAEFVKAGMNVIRLNFSHGDFAEHGARVESIREVNAELGTNVAILLDTRGPEIRTNLFENGGINLVKGQHVVISMTEVLGTPEKFSVNYPGLIGDVEVGGAILLDDGYVGLKVVAIDAAAGEITVEVENNAFVKDRRGVNVPGAILSMPFLSEKDINDIIWGCQIGVDYVAASFTRRPEDVIAIRELLDANGGENIQIIPKIENQESVDKIEAIVEVSDGIMVARGDLGVEVPAEEVPVMQKRIIEVCNAAGKPVITATQMLESMQQNPRPTRAEVSDVANAVLDGTDAVMLSGESAAGDYVLESVETQNRIAARMQSELDHEGILAFAAATSQGTVNGAIGLAVADSVLSLDAKFVVALTQSGATARAISKFRPAAPILALVPNGAVARSLALSYGVNAIVTEELTSFEQAVTIAREEAVKNGAVAGDVVVLTGGYPTGQGKTNLMHVMSI